MVGEVSERLHALRNIVAHRPRTFGLTLGRFGVTCNRRRITVTDLETAIRSDTESVDVSESISTNTGNPMTVVGPDKVVD